MEFPRLVYKSDAVYKCVNTIEEWGSAIAGDWFDSVVDAKSLKPQKAPEVVEVPQDNAPPTRTEMETKARELGIKFDGRTGDKKLLQLIDAAMEA